EPVERWYDGLPYIAEPRPALLEHLPNMTVGRSRRERVPARRVLLNQPRLGAIGRVSVLIIMMLAAIGCSRSPEARTARHLLRGDSYTAHERFREAILEYRNALRLDPANQRAIAQLGLAHYQLGELQQALRYLLKAGERAPDAPDIRLKVATIYFLQGKGDDARREAALLLEHTPQSLDALVLWANMAATAEQLEDAARRLERLQVSSGDRARQYQALGI